MHIKKIDQSIVGVSIILSMYQAPLISDVFYSDMNGTATIIT